MHSLASEEIHELLHETEETAAEFLLNALAFALVFFGFIFIATVAQHITQSLLKQGRCSLACIRVTGYVIALIIVIVGTLAAFVVGGLTLSLYVSSASLITLGLTYGCSSVISNAAEGVLSQSDDLVEGHQYIVAATPVGVVRAHIERVNLRFHELRVEQFLSGPAMPPVDLLRVPNAWFASNPILIKYKDSDDQKVSDPVTTDAGASKVLQDRFERGAYKVKRPV